MSAPTTLTAFLSALSGLTVTGVTRKLTAPPASIDTADAPISWPAVPELDDAPLTFGTHGGWPELRGDLVVALEPYAQGTTPANFAATVTMMDNLSAALRATAPGVLGQGPVTWTVRLGVAAVSGTQWWAAVASVVAHG